MSDQCPNCARLQAENARLWRENLLLKQRTRRLKEVVKRQKRQLDDVRIYVGKVMNDAGKVFSQHQPRGTWALWKGKNEVATRVYGLVKFDWITAVLDIFQENL